MENCDMKHDLDGKLDISELDMQAWLGPNGAVKSSLDTSGIPFCTCAPVHGPHSTSEFT
jgi:hypothetical protein